MKCFQEHIDSTQSKAHPAENTIEMTEEQIYYLLISEMAEKHDLVHETDWVNEPRQLHYVHQQKRLSEWERFEVPFLPNRTVKKHCGGNWNILFMQNSPQDWWEYQSNKLTTDYNQRKFQFKKRRNQEIGKLCP